MAISHLWKSKVRLVKYSLLPSINEPTGDGIAVAEFTAVGDVTKMSMSDELTFAGLPLKLLPAFLIWMPFSLPTNSPVSLREETQFFV